MLTDSNIPKDTYSLDGGLPNEAYCLNQNGIDGKLLQWTGSEDRIKNIWNGKWSMRVFL